ncbi:uncharacterized protein LOC108031517 isoform X2 [Drosophila biarmipes]|uniref:uncharacterized protein LOC108031517 isoform X2 n=1 Tax=Drosophila biarmipes TaxID=125945 RepID=UPI0007E8AF3F|nr:uncharacterized protein LOC108031517 isoform X2 [Drosophila biarmipes]
MKAAKRLRASTQEWCDRNSKPKVPVVQPFVRPEPTRWQKPGPMGRNEWANFHSSYQVDAMASEMLRKEQRLKGGKQSPDRKGKGSEPTSEDDDFLRENQERLSMPRWQRKKYIAPTPKEFPFRPHLTGRRTPRPERGRPVQKPTVPCCFQHVDLENEFWANMRFPISRKALLAYPSKKICELSRPRQLPRKPHCPVPVNLDDQMPRRRKMSPRQWRLHLQRLEFLSKPNPRVMAELVCCCYLPKQIIPKLQIR